MHKLLFELSHFSFQLVAFEVGLNEVGDLSFIAPDSLLVDLLLPRIFGNLGLHPNDGFGHLGPFLSGGSKFQLGGLLKFLDLFIAHGQLTILLQALMLEIFHQLLHLVKLSLRRSALLLLFLFFIGNTSDLNPFVY